MNSKMDYSDLAKIKTAKQKQEERKRELIAEDIRKIDEALESTDVNVIRMVHQRIDGKYQACISKWAMGLYAYDLQHGVIYDNLDMESLKDNLSVMKPKLEAYIEGWNAKTDDSDNQNVNVVVNNTNNLNISLSFENAKQRIEEMEGLTQEETAEIQDKIDELERISKENITKKKKWAKVKPILLFALDKSVDVAVMLWSLCIQKSLGM